MGRDMRKQIKEIVRKVRRTKGWTVEITSHSHYKFISPDGKCCFGPCTPSDSSSAHHVRRKLRGLGFVI